MLIAYTLNELAWPIGTVALAVLVYRRTGSAIGAMAYILAAQFVPALISPLLVGRIDRLAARVALPVEIVLVQHSLHGGAGGYGALVSAWGAGSLAGSAIYARWRNLPPRTLIVAGAGLLAAGFVLMAAAWALSLVIAGSALAGIGKWG